MIFINTNTPKAIQISIFGALLKKNGATKLYTTLRHQASIKESPIAITRPTIKIIIFSIFIYLSYLCPHWESNPAYLLKRQG